MKYLLSSGYPHGGVMNKQVIFNLAVKDLDKSKAFFSALGLSLIHI